MGQKGPASEKKKVIGPPESQEGGKSPRKKVNRSALIVYEAWAWPNTHSGRSTERNTNGKVHAVPWEKGRIGVRMILKDHL